MLVPCVPLKLAEDVEQAGPLFIDVTVDSLLAVPEEVDNI